MRTLIALLALVLPSALLAQPRCVKGIPCGNTCIAANRTCRVGPPPPSTTTPPRPVATPAAPSVSPAASAVRPLLTAGDNPDAGTGFQRVRMDVGVHYVLVDAAHIADRVTFDDAIRRYCVPARDRFCSVHFWNNSKDIPTTFPPAGRADSTRIAAYQQDGITGSFEFYFIRGGKPVR